MDSKEFKELIKKHYEAYIKENQYIVEIVNDTIKLARRKKIDGKYEHSRRYIINKMIKKYGGDW